MMRRARDVQPPDLRTLSREELEEVYRKTLDLAAKLLSYRALSASALREKLIDKGCAEEAADYALAYLQEHGFQDDRKYAESTVRSYTRRGYGTLRIRQELRRRGIERDDADAVMEDCEPDLDAMLALLDKRLHGDLSDRKEVGKAVAALQRRGFLWEDIRRALNEYGASIDADFD